MDRSDAPWPRPIEAHGAIGDSRTLALTSDHGEVVWWCWPRFDSPSLFGRLLDPDGGHWSIAPADGWLRSRQFYVANTNLLVTRFHTDDAIVEIEDFLAVGGVRRLVRRVTCLRGSARIRTEVAPRPNYGRTPPELRARDGVVEVVVDGDGEGDGEVLLLVGDVDWTVEEASASATFVVDEGETVTLALGESSDVPADEVRTATYEHWKRWISQCRYTGRWREAVERSALALKLLIDDESGAVLAAGTTSLPEAIGGGRNWDYRYVWIRDASFSLYALLELGFRDEATAFTAWLLDRLADCTDGGEGEGSLRPLYDIDGRHEIDETELDHWRGYEDSTPVRVGNGASGQLQLDIYGELIDSLYLADKYGDGLGLDAWEGIVRLVDEVIGCWEEPDEGIWEPRSGRQRYTSSLLMCWVAVERAIRMADRRGRPHDRVRWHDARDEMHRTLLDRGWNDDLGAFTQTLDGDVLDASILLAPLVKFLPATDPRWRSTLDAIESTLAHGPLVDRYDTDAVDDGLEGGEGSFLICSFWFVEALARAGEVERAEELFDRLLTHASPVGLLSEQIGADGRQLGNTPQAFSHLALISAAVHLDEAIDAAARR